MQFFPPSGECVTCTVDGLEEMYRHLIMPHAQIKGVTGEFGLIISQGITGSDFNLYQHHFFIEQPVTLFAKAQQPMLAINYMLAGSPMAQLAGIGEVVLAQDTYQMFYVPAVAQPVFFDVGTYHCIHVGFDPQYLAKMVGRHPMLKQLVECATQESKLILPHATGLINSQVKNIMNAIIHTDFDGTEIELYMRGKVIELLLLYVRTHHTLKVPAARINNDRLSAVAEYINDNTHQELNIPAMARAFGMSASTLRRHFLMVYQIPVYQYFLKCRLQKGMELLEQRNKTISEIADELGYNDISAFTRAFIKMYGNPPAYYLK